MPVLPALKPLFDAINAMGNAKSLPARLSTAELRELTHVAMERNITGFYSDEGPLPVERDLSVPVEGGAITVRLYAPESHAPLPCHLYLHGGGFWLGRLDHFDAPSRGLAREAECAVASVDYRLAPEHKFPVAAEDAYAALCWLRTNAETLGIDATRISVGGVSAGGNLATVIAMMARDRGAPAPVLQVLEVPVLDLANHDTLRLPDEGIELHSGKDRYGEHYLGDWEQAALPHVSPLLAPDLSGLPPALVMCAEYDPLAAEGKAYAERLAAAGVQVDYHLWKGQFHGSQPMARLIPEEAATYQTIIATTLRRAFGSD
jgi:acetyl esterase